MRESQPELHSDALGLFAEASVSLHANAGSSSLQDHVSSLARLTSSDLVLLYEARPDEQGLTLAAQWGLTPEVEEKFRVLGPERTGGAGGLRAVAGDEAPLAYEPLTDDLDQLGIRAYWAYPLWAEGELIGQLFFGSFRWDKFHRDALSVFAATTIQMAQAIQRRRPVAAAETGVSSWTDAGGSTAARKRQEFIAVLAHELRNPISPIRSGLDLLSTGSLGIEEEKTTLQMMQRQVAHLVRLIDDLLDTVRLNTGRLQVKREPVLMRDVVRSAIESIRPALHAKSQALRLDDDVAENVVIDADPVRLAQAFVNILSANVKQTPEGGVIAVSVALASNELRVTFEDEGPEMNADELHHMFELFPKSPMEQSDDGLGIGLALVKGLVELNDGSIEVGSRESGHGCIYTVKLPRAISNDVSNTEKAPGGTSVPEWPSHRVLVVDDNRDAAETLGLLFELDGHTIRLAHDGPSAVEEAREFQPEVIVMDIGLPGFSGVEAVRRIRAQEGAVRPIIVALTGWGAAADREASRAAGCDLHLVKPVAHEDLQQRILEVLRRGNGEQAAA